MGRISRCELSPPFGGSTPSRPSLDFIYTHAAAGSARDAGAASVKSANPAAALVWPREEAVRIARRGLHRVRLRRYHRRVPMLRRAIALQDRG